MPPGVTCTCVPCNRTFASKAARIAHINNSPRHPRCEPCKRGFLDEDARERHLLDSPRHFWCANCKREFASLGALEAHRRMQSAGRNSTSEADAADSDSDSDSEAEFEYQLGSRRFREFERQDFLHTIRGDRFVDFLPNILSESSSDEDDDGSYLDVASEQDDDSDEGDESSSDADTDSDSDSSESDGDVDSDFLAHTSSSDNDSEASETPIALSADMHRSTITRRPNGSSPSGSTTTASTSFTPTPHPLPPLDKGDKGSAGSGSHIPEVRRTSSSGHGLGSGYVCPLCLEQDGDGDEVTALELTSVKCGHVFCTPCITRALTKKHQCPVCRARARTKDLRRIYLCF